MVSGCCTPLLSKTGCGNLQLPISWCRAHLTQMRGLLQLIATWPYCWQFLQCVISVLLNFSIFMLMFNKLLTSRILLTSLTGSIISCQILRFSYRLQLFLVNRFGTSKFFRLIILLSGSFSTMEFRTWSSG